MQLDQAEDGDAWDHGGDERREETHPGQIDACNWVIRPAPVSRPQILKIALTPQISHKITNFTQTKREKNHKFLRSKKGPGVWFTYLFLYYYVLFFCLFVSYDVSNLPWDTCWDFLHGRSIEKKVVTDRHGYGLEFAICNWILAILRPLD